MHDGFDQCDTFEQCQKTLHSVQQDILKELKLASQTGENTFPLILKCVEAYSTLGEISDALRLSFGEQGDFGAF